MSALSQAQRSKGDTFLQEGENTLKKSTWFASSTERKYEDAAESFTKAANAYKVGGCHDEAGNAYQRAAELYKDKLKIISKKDFIEKITNYMNQYNFVVVCSISYF